MKRWLKNLKLDLKLFISWNLQKLNDFWPLTFMIFVDFIWVGGIFGLRILGTFDFELKYDGVFWREIFTWENITGNAIVAWW